VKVETTNASSSKNTGNKEGGSTSHSDNESYSARDLMTPDEIINMNDDTELIVLTNRSPITAGKAYQFKLFPEPENLLNQNEYENRTKQTQINKFEESIEQFEAEQEEKEIKREERRTALEEAKEKAKDDKKQKSMDSLLDDLEEEDSLNEPVDV